MKGNNLYQSDKELIDQALNGDENAFRHLFEKYWNDLYKIAYRRLPSEEDVKDILQEVFISFWKNIKTITITDSIGGYLNISLRNKIFNFYEKDRVKFRILMDQPFNPIQSEDEIYSSLQTKELSAVLNEIIEQMPSKMKEIYLLSREEQLSNAEIVALLMLSPQTIKNQIHQALKRLREGLAKNTFELFFLFIYFYLRLF